MSQPRSYQREYISGARHSLPFSRRCPYGGDDGLKLMLKLMLMLMLMLMPMFMSVLSSTRPQA